MSSSLRRGTLAATAIAACALALTACGAGNNAASLKVHPDSPHKKVGTLKVQAVNLITTEEGDGPLGLSARIFNDARKPEKLEAVRIAGIDGRVRLSPPAGEDSLTVPAQGHLALGGKGHASALAPEAGSVRNGDLQRVTFVFSRTGKVTLRAAVVSADQGDYAGFGPSTVPTPPGAPTGAPSPRPSAPTGSPTGSPTAPGEEVTEPAEEESPATGASPAAGGGNSPSGH